MPRRIDPSWRGGKLKLVFMGAPSFEVLIVGAGPTGSTLALLLARAGVRSTLIESRAGPLAHPAACILATRTMEVFREIGLAGSIRARCQNIRERSDIRWVTTLAGRELGRLSALPSDPEPVWGSSAEHTTHFPQNRLEPLLWQCVRDEPCITFLPGTRCLSLRETQRGVEAVLDGGPRRVLGDYLVACDGTNGSIRRWLGIDDAPRVLEHMIGVHFTADLGPLVQHRESILYWVLNPRILGVLIAHWFPEEWVLFSPYFPPAQTPHELDRERSEALVEHAIGMRPADLHIRQVCPWVLGAHLAARYRLGRVLLAGDAAHGFPPTGGLGLNTGVQDAHNLAWKLAALARGKAGPALLDTYEQERRPVAQTNLEHSVDNYERMNELLGVVQLDFRDRRWLDALQATRAFRALPDAWQRRVVAVVVRLALRRLGRFGAETRVGASARRELERRLPGQAGHYRFLGLDLGVVYPHGALVGASVDDVTTEDDVGVYRPTTRPGARLPHLWVEDGMRRVALHDVLAANDFVLLTDAQGKVAWQRAAKSLPDVRCLCIGRTSEAELFDVHDAWPRTSEVGPGGAVLVRPDGHVAWRSRTRPHDCRAVLAEVLERISYRVA